MCALMSENSCRLLGFYDEISAFLINLYRGRGLSDSHKLSLFLQLYNAHPWEETRVSHLIHALDNNVQTFIPIHLHTVSGDANCAMCSTQLIVGGFTQPGVARWFIEMPSHADKALIPLFLSPIREICMSRGSGPGLCPQDE